MRFVWLLLIGLAAPAPAVAQELPTLVFQTDWRAQAEHGGFYQALAEGLYELEGLNVTIRPGGPGTNIVQLIATGAVDVVLASNSFHPINLVAAGGDGLAVAAIFQKDPQVLMAHPGRGASTLNELKGRPVFVAAGAIGTFWPWLKERHGFEDSQLRRYSFSLAPWLANPEALQEGYLSSEPFIAAEAGVKPEVHLLADHGYPGYAALIMVSGRLIRERPEVVQGFVNASIEGWSRYLLGDPGPGNALILDDNPEMTEELIAYSIRVMNENGIATSGDAAQFGMGAMTAARWTGFTRQMSALGLVEPGTDPTAAYTLEYLQRAWQAGYGHFHAEEVPR